MKTDGLSGDEQAARNELLAVAEDSADTAMVELAEDVELEVKDYISGQDQETLEKIDEQNSVTDALDDILDVLCGAPGTEPGDDDYTGVIVAPAKYAKREAWRDVYRIHGSAFLMEALSELVKPSIDRMKTLGERDA